MTERVADGTWIVELPLPHAGVVSTTNCVLIADAGGGVHLVDPGWDTPDNRARLVAGLADAGYALADVRSAVATHLHPDHLGLASALRAEHAVPVVLHRRELAAIGMPMYPDPEGTVARWGVPRERLEEVLGMAVPRSRPLGFGADVAVDDGDRLDIPGREVRVVHTPGHTAGSMCLHDVARGLLLTGDHVLPHTNPGLGLGGFAPDDDPLGAALASYVRIAEFDDAEVIPGHGAPFRGVAARAVQIAERHRRRNAEIGALHAAHPEASVWEIAEQVAWTGGWDALDPFHRLSALSQTEMHVRHLGRATLDG